MDHEANVATWLALQRKGVEIRWWRMRRRWHSPPGRLERVLNSQTRLVACTAASNALGSIVNVKEVARMAHAVGAEVFLDAVHYAPHGPIDVQELDCDYLVCSGYKIFAPAHGFSMGQAPALEALPTFREDFIPDQIPTKIEVGTFVYENVAGMDSAVAYLEELGIRTSTNGRPRSRRTALLSAMDSIRDYELRLSTELLKLLSQIDDVTVYGIGESEVRGRVPTFCFNLKGVNPAAVTVALAEKGIGVRDGNMYSPRLLGRLGIPSETGAVRASLAHYNTVSEVGRFAEEFRAIARG